MGRLLSTSYTLSKLSTAKSSSALTSNSLLIVEEDAKDLLGKGLSLQAQLPKVQGNQVKSDKTLVPQPEKMYRIVDSPLTPPKKFELSFEGKLSQDNG